MNIKTKKREKYIKNEVYDKQSDMMKTLWTSEEYRTKTKEARKKFKSSNKYDAYIENLRGKMLGENNHMHGKNTHCWVTNGVDNHLIKVEDFQKYVDMGYVSGQTRNKERT